MTLYICPSHRKCNSEICIEINRIDHSIPHERRKECKGGCYRRGSIFAGWCIEHKEQIQLELFNEKI